MKISLSLLFFGAVVVRLSAADFSFAGAFSQDSDVQLIQFNVSSASDVIIRTLSYAGGTNAAGIPILEGGFDPYLAVFNSSGDLVKSNDDGASVPASSVTGLRLDAFIDVALAPGAYTLALTQFDNLAVGPSLASGFAEEGNENFTLIFGCLNASFCDFGQNNRSSSWAFDLLNVASATRPGELVAVPEPRSALLVAASILAFYTFWRTSGSSSSGKIRRTARSV